MLCPAVLTMSELNLEAELITLFCDNYFAHLSTHFQAWDDFRYLFEKLPKERWLTCQEAILKQINCSKYPVSKPYRNKIGIWLANLSYDSSVPFHQGLKDFLTSNDGEKEPEYIFKTYPILTDQDGLKLTLLEENRDPLSHGTTGLVSWQGAVMLLEWTKTFQDLFRGRSVLELGSGLGLFGLSLSKLAVASSVTLTDCHPKVLNFLQLNRRLNFEKAEIPDTDLIRWTTSPPEYFGKDESVLLDNGTQLNIKHLDWENFQTDQLPSDIDIIVGSDIVYADQLVIPLVRVIKAFLSNDKNNGKCTSAYIACTHRNGDVVTKFLNTLRQEGLEWQVQLKRTFSPLDYIMTNHETLKSISLYKISYPQ